MNLQTTTRASVSSPSIRWPGRTIPLSHGRHLCGRLAIDSHPILVDFESQLERDAIDCLARQPNLVAIATQPFRITFFEEGHRHRYTPDILVGFSFVPRLLARLGFARWTAVEVKPVQFAVLHAEALRVSLEAVRRMLGLAAVCLTEIDLARLTRKAGRS